MKRCDHNDEPHRVHRRRTSIGDLVVIESVRAVITSDEASNLSAMLSES